MLGESITFELAVSLTRDLALIFPSKHVLSIFTRFLTTFKESKKFSILKAQIVKTLNLMLIRTPKEQINNTIKITLPTLIKENFMNESQQIFENVPD
jgi:hypothetical protein